MPALPMFADERRRLRLRFAAVHDAAHYFALSAADGHALTHTAMQREHALYAFGEWMPCRIRRCLCSLLILMLMRRFLRQRGAYARGSRRERHAFAAISRYFMR